MQSINQWIHKILSLTTYFCRVKLQGDMASKLSVITILRIDSKWILNNRLLNRLKCKTPSPHIHIAKSSVIKILNLQQFQLVLFSIHKMVAHPNRQTDGQCCHLYGFGPYVRSFCGLLKNVLQLYGFDSHVRLCAAFQVI